VADQLVNKLNKFSALVMEDAEKKRDALVEQIRKEKQDQLEEKENEFLSQAYEEIQKNITQVKKEDNERILHMELESKKRLLLKRENIISDVFDAVSAKINHFMEEEQYEAWLMNKIEKAFTEVGEGSKVIYLTKRDLRFQEDILKHFSQEQDEISIEATEERDFIGGVKVFNAGRRISVDYSLKELLAQQKNTFLQTSGLTIE
jgi:V/A-type H+-transporting ATPase subunit E